MWAKLCPDPCVPSGGKDSSIVRHDIGLLSQHALDEFGILRAVFAEDELSFRQDLVQEGAMEAVEIDQVNRPTERRRQIFDQMDPSLPVKRHSPGYSEIEVTLE